MQQPEGTPDPRRWAALGLLAATQFMLVIDVSIINVALPSIQKALHFSESNLQWVASGYALTFGGFLLLGGRAADLLGRRLIFMVGLAVFSAASLVCGLAQSDVALVAARAVQGLGAAFVAPAALSILTTTFAEGSERNKALGVWGAVSGAGGAVGVLLGGVLTEKLSWPWIFYVNVPIGVIALLLTRRFVAESRVEGAERSFDVLGAVLATGGLSSLVFALVQTNTAGWGWSGANTLSFFALAAVLLSAFVVAERRQSSPLLEFDIFRNRALTGANIVGFLVGGAIFSMFFFISLYMQNVLHYSPLETGVRYLPLALTIMASAGASQAIVTRVGVRAVLVVGLTLTTIALLFFARLPTNGTYVRDLLPGFIVFAIGMGASFIPITIASLQGVEDDRAGLASGLINTSQQIGGAMGIALLSTILVNQQKSVLASLGESPEAFAEAFTSGCHAAFLVGAGLTALGIVATLVFLRSPARSAA
jgi:EmrB/QacA subfamily drug resistance transporter